MNENRQTRDFILIISCVLTSVLKCWKMILASIAFFAMLSDGIQTLLYHPQYASSVQVSLNSGDTTYSQLEQTQTYIKTLNYMFNGQAAYAYVSEQMDKDAVEYTCSMKGSSNSNLATLTVTANTRRESWFALQNLLEWYEENGEKYHLNYDMNVTETHSINEQPVYINSHLRNQVYGGVFGGIMAILLLLVRIYFHPTIKTPSEISYRIDCRMIAKLPKERKRKNLRFWKKKKEALLVTSLSTSFRYKEAVKKLCSRVEESAKQHGYQSIMMTSVLENEGKSSAAVNLAISLAKNGHKVLMVDGDIRKPSLHLIFNLDTKKNINQYLKGEGRWQDQVESVQRMNLDVICAEADLEHAEELLSSKNMRTLLSEVKDVYDYIVIDCPPSAGMSDSRIISEHCDAVLLVIRQNMANVNSINEIIDRLVSVKNNLIGCIYNGSIYDWVSEQKAYGYRYRYNRYSNTERRG